MAKRKPDPDFQRMVFNNIPSDMKSLFEYLVKIDLDIQNDQIDVFKKLSKQKQEQALTDYFIRMVRNDATARVGENLVISHITDYHIEQRRLKNKIAAKEDQPSKPLISR
ncbi:MAG: hypothetical protein H6937_02580 [Burkholderiales bacterium]|nr:hypothetical protein [Burkholderiales bacterium]